MLEKLIYCLYQSFHIEIPKHKIICTKKAKYIITYILHLYKKIDNLFEQFPIFLELYLLRVGVLHIIISFIFIYLSLKLKHVLDCINK